MTEFSDELCIQMKNELSLFHFLDEDDLVEMPCYFALMELSKGETLCREGDPCDYVAFIVSGSLEIKKQTEFEGKQVILGVYSKGSIVGELCILDGQPRAISAEALEDTTLVVLSRKNLDKLIEEHPELGVKFLKGMLVTVSIRLRKSFDRLAAIF